MNPVAGYVPEHLREQYVMQLKFYGLFFLVKGVEKGFEAKLTVTPAFQVAICMHNNSFHPNYSSSKCGHGLKPGFLKQEGVCVFCLLFSPASNNVVDRKAELVVNRPSEGSG